MNEIITHKAPSKFAFVCKNGVKVHSITELLEQIKQMTNEEFKCFVHHGHNHFANWIEDIFELEDLPNAMRSVTTKRQTIAVIEAANGFADIGTSEKKAGSKKHVNEKSEEIHHQISHLHTNLNHMTRYDTHTPKHKENARDPITQEIKDKLVDFGFGLIIGLIVGMLIGKTIGAF